MMKHKTTALPMYNDETITMLRASEDVRDSSRFRTFCDTGMTCIGLVWKIVSEIWLMVLITLMTFGVFDMFFHMANWEKRSMEFIKRFIRALTTIHQLGLL